MSSFKSLLFLLFPVFAILTVLVVASGSGIELHMIDFTNKLSQVTFLNPYSEFDDLQESLNAMSEIGDYFSNPWDILGYLKGIFIAIKDTFVISWNISKLIVIFLGDMIYNVGAIVVVFFSFLGDSVSNIVGA